MLQRMEAIEKGAYDPAHLDPKNILLEKSKETSRHGVLPGDDLLVAESSSYGERSAEEDLHALLRETTGRAGKSAGKTAQPKFQTLTRIRRGQGANTAHRASVRNRSGGFSALFLTLEI